MVHRLDDPRDPDQPFHPEVELLIHHANDHRKLLEVIGFRGSQWICFEERHDGVAKINPPEDLIDHQIFLVVVVSSIPVDTAAAEEVLDQFQAFDAPFSLDDCEHRLQLPPDPHNAVALDRTTEAAFTVDEADDPLLDSWPFLLIARTGRVFTAHTKTLSRATDMNEYRRILGCSSKQPAALYVVTDVRGSTGMRVSRRPP
jgi:hypothetical protein